MSAPQGFLEQLGIGAQDESAARKNQRNAQLGGNDQAGRAFLLGQQGSGIVHGAANAIGGLISGQNSGRSVSGLRQNFLGGFRRREEDLDAEAAGITTNQLRVRKSIRAATASFSDDGTLQSRIDLAKKVAQIARDGGDFATMANALRQITELEREQKEFQKLGIETETEKRVLDFDKEIGFEARHINDDANVSGKAVRINDGEDAGKYLLIRPGVEDEVVRGGDLVGPNLPGSIKAGRVLAQDTLQGLVKANGALPGNIGKMRGNMTSMGESAAIVSNIASLLIKSIDPQAILSATGKTSIAADKTISFVESVSAIFSDPRVRASQIRWNGKRVSAVQQHAIVTRNATSKDGILTAFLREQIPGLSDIGDALPDALRGNALAAEQYWANVMELAYLDARLMEPSNRGLSDNDIKNALKRIGADTANPLSFAVRQIEVINTKLLPQLENLGSDFTNFQSSTFSTQDIINEVYNTDARLRIEDALLTTRAQLQEVIAGGRRGVSPDAGADGGDNGFGSDDDIAEELRRLEEEE